MINIKEPSKCCGCFACYNICPKKAIVMKCDDKGFKYPIIDKDKCIDCGLCEKVCPMNKNKNNKNNYNKRIYAIYNNNEIERKLSSSGGIFTLLAKEIINNNGIVFGSGYDKKFMVNHFCIEMIEDIYKLRGSKYLQSDIRDAYSKTKKLLDTGRLVLFTGTSCQIEGLYSFLGRNYNNLFTQDLICHGVPSPKVWKKYLDYMKVKFKDEIKSIEFRNKDNGWENFNIKIIFNKNIYKKCFKDDIYMNAFLNNICLRDSCYNCKFKNNYRNSDITLADFWGINEINKEMNDNKGISMVIINSKKGEILFSKIKNHCIYKEVKIEDISTYNSAYIASAAENKNTKQFFKNIDKYNFKKLIKKYINKKSHIERIKRRVIELFIK